MLTPKQIAELNTRARQLVDPLNALILDEMCERIAAAGDITRTTDYLMHRTQELGVKYDTIEKELIKRLDLTKIEIERMFEAAAKESTRMDYKNMKLAFAEFEDNKSLQQIVKSSIELAQENFTNITQTLGMVTPLGEDLPLKRFYQKTMDWMFNTVSTGILDYDTAIRRVSNRMADVGITSIGYESGVVTTIEAATRRNIMGGLGLMVEEVTEANAKALSSNGWEISAHSRSAPDHEPYQGRTYTNKEYGELNATLKRRIGTLNCGHVAMPIILGINTPQYTEEKLKQMREENKIGVIVNGKHYMGYEATQRQRELERNVRSWGKRDIAANKSNSPVYKKHTKVNLTNTRRKYREFSKSAGLRTQWERTYIVKR